MKGNLMRNIGLIARCAALYRDTHLEHIGISGYQAAYVLHICRRPGIAQDRLAQNLHVNRSSVTRQLALLEEKGFITRERYEADKRVLCVYPTKEMQAVLPEVQACFRQWREALTEGMQPAEIEIMEELLERLALRAEELQ